MGLIRYTCTTSNSTFWNMLPRFFQPSSARRIYDTSSLWSTLHPTSYFRILWFNNNLAILWVHPLLNWTSSTMLFSSFLLVSSASLSTCCTISNSLTFLSVGEFQPLQAPWPGSKARPAFSNTSWHIATSLFSQDFFSCAMSQSA